MDVAICGPGHAVVLPPNVERIDAPTPTVFVIGRLAVDGPDDVPAVHALQDEMFLGPFGWQSMYVNDPIEAYYPPIYADLNDAQLDGASSQSEIRFSGGNLPPVDAFWAITLYDLQKRLMVDNDIERYSIGDRTSGLVRGDDGALNITIGHDAPTGKPGRTGCQHPPPPFC